MIRARAAPQAVPRTARQRGPRATGWGSTSRGTSVTAWSQAARKLRLSGLPRGSQPSSVA